MIIIAHRGNLNGPSSLENKPDYVMAAVDTGFDVEIDVWLINGCYYLGHDTPKYLIDREFLRHSQLWCHAKNFDALEAMLEFPDVHCFWHESDKFTLTSEGTIWTYPGQQTGRNSILVTNEDIKDRELLGVCTDYPFKYTA